MARVLIVDDDPDGSDAVCRFLRRAKHEAARSPNGREALAALHSIDPEVVILDVLMPEMDGIDFLKVLRMYRRGQTLPVIVLTALPPGGAEVERLSRLGIDRVFHKASCSLPELLACVNQLATLGKDTTAAPPAGSDWATRG